MGDYIKREDAIKTVYKLREHFKCWDRDDDIAIKNTLNAIPPADVRENVRGEWVGGELGECSICGHKGCASDIWTGCNEKYYCPNCGAELVVE